MGSENCVEYLLKYDYININNQDKTNLMTALHLATATANNSIVKKHPIWCQAKDDMSPKKLFKLQLMQNMQYEKTLSQSSKLKELSHIEISDCRTFHKLDNSPLYSTRFIEVEKF